MSVVQQLSDLAAAIAEEMQQRRSALEAEPLELETRKREIGEELRATDLGRERLSHFQVKIDGEYQCPNCWVRDDVRTPLTSIELDGKEEFFRCGKCGCEARVDWPDK